ncbi:MAG TPA: vitamin K epoxide reductase family protein [Ktedonobacterales bacterium]
MKIPMLSRERVSSRLIELETHHPEVLSQQLRQASDRFLRERRGVIGLSLVAATALSLISLYQMGILKRLPEPKLPRFNAEKVNSSAEAYRWLETPDAFLGLGSYVATMTLAAMGGPKRAEEQPWIPLALAAKVGADTALAGFQVLMQARKLRTFCSWCLLTGVASFGSIPLVIPEARYALKQLMGR